RFSDYLKVARVEEAGVVHCGDACVKNIIDTTAFLLDEERKIVKLAAEVGDDTTVALLGDYIREQEKELWMLAAFTAEGDTCHKN
ncbi:MAG: DNA starvation/stationary phase protection protein, partial [Bacteroidales bacterium]|nr:DNA starvation/stationary phase protection protein [Bacteroidales bacterium]